MKIKRKKKTEQNCLANRGKERIRKFVVCWKTARKMQTMNVRFIPIRKIAFICTALLPFLCYSHFCGCSFGPWLNCTCVRSIKFAFKITAKRNDEMLLSSFYFILSHIFTLNSLRLSDDYNETIQLYWLRGIFCSRCILLQRTFSMVLTFLASFKRNKHPHIHRWARVFMCVEMWMSRFENIMTTTCHTIYQIVIYLSCLLSHLQHVSAGINSTWMETKRKKCRQ